MSEMVIRFEPLVVEAERQALIAVWPGFGAQVDALAETFVLLGLEMRDLEPENFELLGGVALVAWAKQLAGFVAGLHVLKAVMRAELSFAAQVRARGARLPNETDRLVG